MTHVTAGFGIQTHSVDDNVSSTADMYNVGKLTGHSDEDKYQYDPALPIRFLEIYLSTRGPLHGRILSFKSLDSPGIPEYETLSYVWAYRYSTIL